MGRRGATDEPNEIEKFGQLLEEKGLKYTFERKKLLQEILQTRKHFDADSLYETMRVKGVRISRDTVYRTMPLLLECGILQKSVGDSRREYFEPTGAKGDHMVCLGCGKVIEFTSDDIESLQTKICETYGFKLMFHDHRLFGYCRKCN
jgi:Fur family transcriptional regulator, ferric uptake regulator